MAFSLYLALNLKGGQFVKMASLSKIRERPHRRACWVRHPVGLPSTSSARLRRPINQQSAQFRYSKGRFERVTMLQTGNSDGVGVRSHDAQARRCVTIEVTTLEFRDMRSATRREGRVMRELHLP
jgi:hypothetical protein